MQANWTLHISHVFVLVKFICSLFYLGDLNVPYGCGKQAGVGQFAASSCGLDVAYVLKRVYLMYMLRGVERLQSDMMGMEGC